MSSTTAGVFFEAFKAKDYATIHQCYTANAVFYDPVFGKLQANEAKAMWKMLLSKADDLQITYQILEEDQGKALVLWEAVYTFGKAKRVVVNKVLSHFSITDGKITEHRDEFDLWKWSSMALGNIGKLLGWTPYLKNKIRKNASRSLSEFIRNNKKFN